MKKLKSGLRFNAQMRTALAIIVATEHTGTMSGDLQELHSEITKDIIGSYWASSELNENFKTFKAENYTNGEFPVVKVLNVTADGVRQQLLVDDTALPFSVYMDQYEAYDNLVDDLTKDMVTEFMEKNSKHQLAFNGVKGKIEEFIKPFTSPAKLLEAAPDFAKHFPESYFTDEDENCVPTSSIADLLAA